jgi:hypothetical protein
MPFAAGLPFPLRVWFGSRILFDNSRYPLVKTDRSERVHDKLPYRSNKQKQTPWLLVRKPTIPTELPQLIGGF